MAVVVHCLARRPFWSKQNPVLKQVLISVLFSSSPDLSNGDWGSDDRHKNSHHERRASGLGRGSHYFMTPTMCKLQYSTIRQITQSALQEKLSDWIQIFHDAFHEKV